MRIAGVTPPFAGRPHLDLFHPLQRLLRGAYADGRLATYESRLVGVERTSDLPGAFAPEAWFDWLAGRPHRLEGVFQHNLDDVLSLATLAAWLGRVEAGTRTCGAELEGPPGRRARGMARSLVAAGQPEVALPWFERALALGHCEGELGPEERRQLAFERAEVLRKGGHGRQALAALDELAEAEVDHHTPLVHEARAKLLEHGLRDPEAALEATLEALHSSQGLAPGTVACRVVRELERRQLRLERRVAAPGRAAE